MLCPRITSSALTRQSAVVCSLCKSVQSCVICTLSSVLCSLKNFTSLVCLLQGGNSLCRLCPVVEMIIPNECNEQVLTTCQHPTGDVRTERERKNVISKGVVYQNNTLNINLMYSYCLLHICSANSAAIVKLQSFSEIEISLHCQDRGLYTVIQLCSYAVLK